MTRGQRTAMRLASMRRGLSAASQCYETSGAAVAEEVDRDGMASRRSTGEDGDACGAVMGMPSTTSRADALVVGRFFGFAVQATNGRWRRVSRVSSRAQGVAPSRAEWFAAKRRAASPRRAGQLPECGSALFLFRRYFLGLESAGERLARRSAPRGTLRLRALPGLPLRIGCARSARTTPVWAKLPALYRIFGSCEIMGLQRDPGKTPRHGQIRAAKHRIRSSPSALAPGSDLRIRANDPDAAKDHRARAMIGRPHRALRRTRSSRKFVRPLS